MRTPPSSAFHLIIEPGLLAPAQWRTPDTADASGVQRYVLPLPGNVSILRAIPGEVPAVHTEPLESPQHELILEPVLRLDSMFRLILVNPTNRRLCVNGERAPRVSLVRECDQFHWDDTCVFHVSILHRPQIGPAPAEKRGKPCPICLAPLTDEPNTICYRCPCGTVLHLKDPTGLECARVVNACPNCKQPITLEDGYTWLPEFCHE